MLTPFDEGFDDLLKGFFVRPMSFEGQTPVQMRIDVKEEDGAYVVHAEIPGVKKEDIPEPPFFFLWLRA